jgi:hypothetical protein
MEYSYFVMIASLPVISNRALVKLLYQLTLRGLHLFINGIIALCWALTSSSLS